VGVGVVLADVVPVARHRLVGGDLFQPDVVVVVEPGFVIFDNN
jgi:hypothetical protein